MVTHQLASAYPNCQSPNGARSRRAGPLSHYAPNQAIPAHKSIRSFPLAAAHPLTVLSWPEALHASGSRRACLMHISRNACSPVALPDFPEFTQAVRYGVPGTPRNSLVRTIFEDVSKIACLDHVLQVRVDVPENEPVAHVADSVVERDQGGHEETGSVVDAAQVKL